MSFFYAIDKIAAESQRNRDIYWKAWNRAIDEMKERIMGKKDEQPPQETKFVPCSLCKAVASEYEITVTQISTGKVLTVLNCCAECADRANAE